MSNDAYGAGGREKINFGRYWDDKLRLTDSIDKMRDDIRTLNAGQVRLIGAAAVDSVSVLQEKLRVYENTCAMLEREVQSLEQQTLAALAEAGRLRRELDRREAGSRSGEELAGDSLKRFMAEAEDERRLLIDALENSEAELARMIKTLDLVARKLQVA